MKIGPHTLIVGKTDSGKSTAAKRLIKDFILHHHKKVLVLDPKKDPGFQADFITKDPGEFMREVKRHAGQECLDVIDESGQQIGRFAREMQVLATQYREIAHRCVFIVQRGADLDKTIRNNCSNLLVFESNAEDAAIMAKQWGVPAIAEAGRFKQGEYLFVPRWGEPVRGNIFDGMKKKP